MNKFIVFALFAVAVGMAHGHEGNEGNGHGGNEGNGNGGKGWNGHGGNGHRGKGWNGHWGPHKMGGPKMESIRSTCAHKYNVTVEECPGNKNETTKEAYECLLCIHELLQLVVDGKYGCECENKANEKQENWQKAKEYDTCKKNKMREMWGKGNNTVEKTDESA